MPAFAASFGQLAYEVLDHREVPHNGGHTRPLFLIGGLTGVKEDWEPLSTALSKSRPVIIFDSRGMGQSEGVTSEITISSLAQDAADLLSHLKHKEVDILGFSYGVIVLLELLSRIASPVTFRHIVFVAGRPFPATPQPGISGANLRDVVFREGLPTSATLDERREYWRPFVHLMYDDEWIASPENHARLLSHVEHNAHGVRNADVYQRQAALLRSYDYRPSLGLISPDVRVLLIHGKKDRAVPYHDSEAFLTGIKHARRIEGLPDDYGHWWYGYFDISVWAERLEAFFAE